MEQLIRVGVFGSPDGWYIRDLQRAALIASQQTKQSFEILPLDFKSLRVDSLQQMQVFANRISSSSSPSPSGASSTQSVASTTQVHSLASLDAVIVRSMPLGSLEQIIFRMNALHVADQLGIPILNSPRCLEVCIDKWLTIQKVRQAGILTPSTIACQTKHEAMEAWAALGKDCVVKPIFGGEGRGIVRVQDEDMAWRVFSTLEQIQAVHYVQEFIPNDGTDLRCLVLGEAIYCMRRRSCTSWKANVTQGGKGLHHEPTFEQVDIAYRSAKAVGGWMVGVDLIEDSCGAPLLIEVNAVPGWRATAQAVQVDIALEMILSLPLRKGP